MKLESIADLFRSLREHIRKNPHERVWVYVLSNKDRGQRKLLLQFGGSSLVSRILSREVL